MRSLPLLVVIVCLAPGRLPAEPASEPKLHTVEGLSFVLPASWKAEQKGAAHAPGVLFVGDGGQSGRITVSRLPASAGAPKLLDPKLDAMTAFETEAFRESLIEAGLTPLQGWLGSANEGEALVESIGFRCKPQGAREVVMLIATWRTPRQAIRARLQFSEGYGLKHGAELDAIRQTVRFSGTPTLGFGPQWRADFGPPPDTPAWTRASGAPFDSPKTAMPLPPPAAEIPARAQPAAGSAPPAIGQFVHDYTPSLVFIEGGGGAGSGFICKMSDGMFVCTNQHVVAGMRTVKITRLDNARLATGAAQAAVGHDLMRLAIADATKPLVAMENVEAEARIGDEVFVLGNSEGARVIQPLAGKLLGIGPDRIEVSAAFVPGNSGSPIVHAKTGKVIGIATYIAQRRYSELADRPDTRVRRFGYRLDSAKQWQPVAWTVFQAERAELAKVETLTKDFERLIEAIRTDAVVEAASFSSSAVSRPVRDFLAAAGRRGVSAADRTRTVQQLLASLRGATQADIVQARQRFRYDFFQRAINEEAEVREEMHRLFDRLLTK